MTAPVLVIGAGPAGLATAACLRQHDVPFRLLDRHGRTGGAYREIYPGVHLASPTSLTHLPGLPVEGAGDYVSAGQYRDYLDRYAAHHHLHAERASVTHIERAPAGFTLTIDGEPVPAPIVVVASGMWDFPVLPDIPGLGPDLPFIHTRAWQGPDADERVRRARILLVGGATSAVEIAEEIARTGRQVAIAARSGIRIARQRFLGLDLHHWIRPLDVLPSPLVRRYCRLRPTLPGTDLGFSRYRKAGLVDVRPAIRLVRGREVEFVDDTRLEVDLLVAATGFRFDTPFLPPEVERAEAGHVLTRRGESVSWPGLYLVGSPCARGIASEFLRGIAPDAAHAARSIAARLGRRAS